jgi:hypothetical protein
MKSARALDSTKWPEPPVAVLSAFILITGAGGMAASFLFLASGDHLDVIAGAVGFLAGAILVAAGLLSLATQSRSQSTSHSAVRVIGCLVGLLPPLAAILAWPVVYFGAFIFGVLLLMPFVLLGCVAWAWVVSANVAYHLSALLGWPRVRILRGFVFVFQVAAILASWPLFGCLLQLFQSMGYKVGWS